MFIASYERTMRNARPKPNAPPPPPVHDMVQIRAERMAKAEAERIRIAERDAREKRHREVLEKIEYSLNLYRQDRVQLAEKIPIRDILRAICEHYEVTVDAIMASNRQTVMTPIRDEAIRAVADARPGMSLPELGRVFGRDPTTIRHSLLKTAKPGFDYRGNPITQGGEI